MHLRLLVNWELCSPCRQQNESGHKISSSTATSSLKWRCTSIPLFPGHRADKPAASATLHTCSPSRTRNSQSSGQALGVSVSQCLSLAPSAVTCPQQPPASHRVADLIFCFLTTKPNPSAQALRQAQGTRLAGSAHKILSFFSKGCPRQAR